MSGHSIWGSIVGAFTAFCCAGFPLALAFLTGIGLGFLINDFILFPILFISLGFMFYSLNYNKRKHLSRIPLYIAIISAIMILIGIYVRPVIWIGVIGLFVATIWDFIIIKKCN